jgi:GntR family transcriptional regulator/MocR family aminotransferase
MWGIDLNRAEDMPLKRQLYLQLKDRIGAGVLAAGEAVISTRELARALNVSRNTVSEAYDMLIAEGWLVSSQGAATRVAEGLRLDMQAERPPEKMPDKAPAALSFKTGAPDLRLLPVSLWRQLIARAASDLPMEQYGYTGPQGLASLRREISAWLLRSRGLTADPEDIFITAGATHALHLAADVLSLEDRTILMEDPCHSGMLRTFLNKKCRVLPVPVDDRGMLTRLLPEASGQGADVAAVYVTPSHQFPLGGILPAPRRTALIRYAREHDLYIIEDDYDSEFRYSGDPVAPLCALEKERVIYVGTFSKVLFPALRIGYAVVPRALQARWRTLRTHDDVQNPPFEQAALSELLRTRRLDSHIRKMRKIYGSRRAVLLEALREVFGAEITASGDASGLHVAVGFPGRRFDPSFKSCCLEAGIDVTPVESHCIVKGRHEDMLLLGYGHMDPQEIRSGVLTLRDVMASQIDT